jgi:hypothetical protein
MSSDVDQLTVSGSGPSLLTGADRANGINGKMVCERVLRYSSLGSVVYEPSVGRPPPDDLGRARSKRSEGKPISWNQI